MANTSFIHATPDATACRCDNCDWTGPASELDDIADVQERLDPGGTVPAGQCPACGALAYLKNEPDDTAKVIIARARNEWADDDISIDDGAKVSVADDGAWVQAWVWLPS